VGEMTQDKIREAFDSYRLWLTEQPYYAAGYTNEQCYMQGYQACAAEMGKDMSEIAKHLKRYVDFYGDIGEARKALALADKWRG